MLERLVRVTSYLFTRNNPILQYVGTMKASDYRHICKLMYKTDYRSRI